MKTTNADFRSWYREYTTAIMCASLPHLKALVSKILPGFFDSAVRSLVNNRWSATYRVEPRDSIGIKMPIQDQYRRSVQQSLRNSGRASVNWPSWHMPGVDRKTAFHDIDGHCEEIMLSSDLSRTVQSSTEFSIQAEASKDSYRRSEASGTSQPLNWPL